MAVRNPNAAQYRKIHIHAVIQKPKFVEIREPWMPLCKGDKEEAEWKIVPRGTPFTVKFDKEEGSPFEENVFTGTDNVTSGPIAVPPEEPPKTYRYSLEVEGFDRIDPGIIIWDWH